jgi:hypothetical protein
MQEGQACLDYGTLRVCDTKQLPLVLKNNGKYAVKYALTLKTSAAKELFTLLPETGAVDPGKETTIQVVFNKAQTLKHEVNLISAPDIQLAIIEPLTSDKVCIHLSEHNSRRRFIISLFANAVICSSGRHMSSTRFQL